MQVHCPSVFSRQRDTLLSPPLTANIPPVNDQLTFQMTSSKTLRMVGVQLV